MNDQDPPTEQNPNAKRSMGESEQSMEESMEESMANEEENYTERDSLNEIRKWMLGGRESTARPLWQQEALQRLYENDSLGGASDGVDVGSVDGRRGSDGRSPFTGVVLHKDWEELLEIIRGDRKSKILRDKEGQPRLTLGQTAPKQAVSNEQPSPLEQSQGQSQRQLQQQSREQKSQGGKIQDQSSLLEQSQGQSKQQKSQAEKSNKQIAKNQAADENSDKPQNIMLTEIANVRGVDALVGGQCLSFVGKEKDGKKDSGGGAVKDDDTFSADGNLTGDNDGSTSGSPILSPLLPPENSPNKGGGNLHSLHSPGGLALLYGDNGSGKSSYARILANACHARKAEEILSNLKNSASAQGNAYPSAVLKYWAYDRADGGKAGKARKVGSSTVGGDGDGKGGGTQANFSPGDVDRDLTSGEHSPFIDDNPSSTGGDTSSGKGRSAEFKAVRWWYVKGKNYFREIDFKNPDKDQVNFPFADVGSGQSDPAQDKASRDIAKQLAEVRVFSDATASVHSEANKAIYTPYPKLLLDQLANACEEMEKIFKEKIKSAESEIDEYGKRGKDLVDEMSNDFDNVETILKGYGEPSEPEEYGKGMKFVIAGVALKKHKEQEVYKKNYWQYLDDFISISHERGEEVLALLAVLQDLFVEGIRIGEGKYLPLPSFIIGMKRSFEEIEQWLDELSHFSERDEKELHETEQWIAKANKLKQKQDDPQKQLTDWVEDRKKQKENAILFDNWDAFRLDELEQKIEDAYRTRKRTDEYWKKMARLNHLRSRRWLMAFGSAPAKKNFIKAIKYLREMGKRIENKKQLEDLKIGQFEVAPLRQKGAEEAAKLVGPRWQKNFKRELQELGLGQLGLEVQRVKGGGETRYQIGFADGSLGGNKLDRVLSGGEFRGAALAAFLAEDVTEGNRSAIIFDDPVSSLDHNYRQKFAHRLATLSKQRQVIVFTHDLMFLWLLQNEMKQISNPRRKYRMTERTILRSKYDIGFCKDYLSIAVGNFDSACEAFEKELHDLKEEEKQQERTNDLLKDDWFIKKMGCCVTFRQLCEKAVEEVIPVFKRLDDDISVSRLEMVTKIQPKHYKCLHKLFSKYSDIVHYSPPNLLPQLPDVEELLVDVGELKEWMECVQVAQGILKKKKS